MAIDTLLNLASGARIRLWLLLRSPDWFTVEEIANGLPLFSKQRVQQILKNEYDRESVLRRERETGKPGPRPFEYQVTRQLFTDVDNVTLEKIIGINNTSGNLESAR